MAIVGIYLAIAVSFLAAAHAHVATSNFALPDTGKQAKSQFSASKQLGAGGIRPGDVSGMAFCSSDQWLATIGLKNQITLWDLKTGKMQQQFVGKDDRRSLAHITYLSATATACTASFADIKNNAWPWSDSFLTFWSLKDGKALADVKAHRGDVTSLVSSGDGKIVVSAGYDGIIKKWDAAQATLLGAVESNALKNAFFDIKLALSADGTKLFRLRQAFDGDNGKEIASTIAAFDLEKGTELWSQEVANLTVSHVALSPDGKLAVCYGRSEGVLVNNLVVWSFAEGKVLYKLPNPKKLQIQSMVFMPDSRAFYTACTDGALRLYNSADGREVSSIKSDLKYVTAMILDRPGKTLAVWDGSVVRIWDLANSKERFPPTGHKSPVNRLAFSADGKLVMSRSFDDLLLVWKTAEAEELFRIKHPKGNAPIEIGDRDTLYNPIAVSPKGEHIAYGRADGIVEVADVKTGKWTRQLKGEKLEICFLAFSADAKSLVVANIDDNVAIWDIENEKVAANHTLAKPAGYMGGSFAATADGRYLAFHKKLTNERQPPAGLSGPSGILGVYDLVNKKLMWETKLGSITYLHRLSLSSDGKHLAVIENDLARGVRVGLWEIESGKRIFEVAYDPKTLRPLTVRCVCYSSDTNVVAIGLESGQIQLWSTKTGAQITDLTGHKGSIQCLALSPDGHTLASGSGDTTILLWDLRAATGQKEKAKGKGFSLVP